MLRLRASTRPVYRGLVRLSSTTAAPAADAAPAAASGDGATPADAVATDATATHGRRKPVRRSLGARGETREWNRPLATGVLPAYDEALALLRADARTLKAELADVQARLKDASGEEADALRKKVEILEIQSEINLPDVRWKSRNGLGDMSKPVYRRLAEQRWRNEGALDLLMERIHQMNVVPDVIPDLHPSFDLRVAFSQFSSALGHPVHMAVEPGVHVAPKDTLQKPRLYATVFHPEPRMYTLLMVDPDVPDPESQSFSTYCHWLQPNITLSASSSEVAVPADAHTPYVPPHPHRGTKYHRYVLLLLPQPEGAIDVPALDAEQRAHFDVRAFCAHYALDGAKGGGAHMWRAVWSEDVSKMYGTRLVGEEPRFGRPRKPDPYVEVKRWSKYAGTPPPPPKMTA